MGMGCAGSLRDAAARHEPPEVRGGGVVNLWVVAASSLEIRIAGSACGSEPKVEETKKQKTETTGERTGETITEQTAEVITEENLESGIGEVEDVPELTPSEPPQPLPVELAELVPAPVEQVPEEVIEEETPAVQLARESRPPTRAAEGAYLPPGHFG